MSLSVLMVVLSGLTAVTVSAQSRSVYGAGLDESAALVRLVNAGAGPGAMTNLRVGGLALSAPGTGDVTSYRPLAIDIYTVSYAGRRREFLPVSGGFYTLVLWAGGLAILDDVKLENPAKAQLAMYNFVPGKQTDLKTADAKTRILGPVEPGTAASILVNPVQVSMAVFAGAARLADAGTVRLERGASYSVFVVDNTAGGQTAFVVKASVSAE